MLMEHGINDNQYGKSLLLGVNPYCTANSWTGEDYEGPYRSAFEINCILIEMEP